MSDSSLSLTRRRLVAAAAFAWLPTPARPRPAPADALTPLLAGVYDGQVDPALCLVGEKYDGVRALWDGHVLRHRSGRAVAAPASFLATLPRESLDGELWLGRGRFDEVSAIAFSSAAA
jgi:DNA ligase 1